MTMQHRRSRALRHQPGRLNSLGPHRGHPAALFFMSLFPHPVSAPEASATSIPNEHPEEGTCYGGNCPAEGIYVLTDT